jgi:hypothetical protein
MGIDLELRLGDDDGGACGGSGGERSESFDFERLRNIYGRLPPMSSDHWAIPSTTRQQGGPVKYIEQRDFNLRFDVRAEFPDDYDGERDGYAWYGEFPPIAAEILRAAVAILAKHPGWTVHTGNRGRSSDDEVTLVLTRSVE